VDIDRSAVLVLPKTADFLEAEPEIVYDETDAETVGTIRYTYAGRTVGEADIRKTGATIENPLFQKEIGADGEEEEVSTIRIRPIVIAAVLAAIVLAVALVIGIRKFIDNYYIIRHNIEVRRDRRAQFKAVKKKTKRRRWRGWRR
jgi:hypothetical protein